MIPQSTKATMFYNFARSYSRSHKTSRGLEFLIKAFNTGLTCSEKLENDPSFDAIREDERFTSLISSVNLVKKALHLEKTGTPAAVADLLVESSRICPEYSYPHYLLARQYAIMNKDEKALLHLEKSIRLGFNNFCFIVGERAFDQLRAREEFQKLLKSPS